MGYLAELDQIAKAAETAGPAKPRMDEQPVIKQYKCLVAMRCDQCGHEEYRYPRFLVGPSGHGTDDVRLREDCLRRVVYMHKYPEDVMTTCRGELLTIPGFNHDLTKVDFEVDAETLTDGRQKGKVRISSLHELRQIENRSLQLAANGEGQPMIFRHFSQNKSNRSKHTLTGTPYEKGRAKPKPSKSTLSGLPITAARTSKPD